MKSILLLGTAAAVVFFLCAATGTILLTLTQTYLFLDQNR